jgi:hypothetical protein
VVRRVKEKWKREFVVIVRGFLEKKQFTVVSGTDVTALDCEGRASRDRQSAKWNFVWQVRLDGIVGKL